MAGRGKRDDEANAAKVDLSESGIKDEEVITLMSVLRHNTRLTDLDLSGNEIRYMGTIELLLALQNHPTLTKLNLSSNKIGADDDYDAFGTLRHLLLENTMLTELNLSNNEGISEENARLLTKSLQNNNRSGFRAIVKASDACTDDICCCSRRLGKLLPETQSFVDLPVLRLTSDTASSEELPTIPESEPEGVVGGSRIYRSPLLTRK